MAFKTIYDEHASCFNIIQCEDCDTVIFEHYDERYEKNFNCPICTDYKTCYEFWTKEEIEADEEKQKIIRHFYKMTELEIETDARVESRNGLYDEQLFKTKCLTTKRGRWEFEGHIDSITNKNKLKGLYFNLTHWKKCKDSDGYTWKSRRVIPCSLSAIRLCIRTVLNEIVSRLEKRDSCSY